MERLDAAIGALSRALALVASVLLLLMLAIICADVLTRNVALPGLPRGLAWSNEVSELLLYLITLLAAPWLLRRGQHIRVDIVLRAIPPAKAWACEWLADFLGLLCCLWMVWYGSRVAWKSYAEGAMSIKTLVTPEWWSLAPLPLAFALLALEMLLRMRRLALGPRGPRSEAVSAA